MSEVVDHPPHYNAHPSGVEAIDICEHLSFNVGNAVKYLFREGHKEGASKDREKAAWYLDREATRIESGGRYPAVPSATQRNIHLVWREEGESRSALGAVISLIYTGGHTVPAYLRRVAAMLRGEAVAG